MLRAMLEIAAGSLDSALAAQAGGADRIELCVSLPEGGLTPGVGLLEASRARLAVPIHVLIRPRAGDFIYGAAELAMMQRDIRACRNVGCEGVVIGALTVDGEVDMPACRQLLEAAQGMDVTFHRAIDASRDPLATLDRLIELGCRRVLTSGAAASAESGAAAIRALHDRAAGRIEVMAGAGLTAANVAGVVAATGVQAVHASAKAVHVSRSDWRNDRLAGLSLDRDETDTATVRAMVAALEAVPVSHPS